LNAIFTPFFALLDDLALKTFVPRRGKSRACKTRLLTSRLSLIILEAKSIHGLEKGDGFMQASNPDSSAASQLPIRFPIANMRAVFRLQDVERKLQRLRDSGSMKERETLANTYERMLESGPERFSVKPSGLPVMDELYESLPNFKLALDDVKRHLALSQDCSDSLQLTPMLLLGPPGVGKTHFARQIAELLGTGMNLVPMSSMTAGWLLSGSSSQWKGSRPGKVFEALVDGQFANPVIVVDEIDKAATEAQYDPLGALYSLLEHDSAQHFIDEFAEVPIDASGVIWVTTANDEHAIPDPILNRMNVFQIEAPDAEASRKIASRMYQQIRSEHGWGSFFELEPGEDALDALIDLAPREMRRAWMTGFGNARLRGSDQVKAADLPAQTPLRRRVGFLA